MSAQPDERLRAKLLKIRTLAESGVAGERENAQALLEQLCKQYGISAESLLSTEKRWVKFHVNTVRDMALFQQCAFYVLALSEISFRKMFKGIAMNLTEAEELDLRACFTHYRNEYRKAEEYFYTAFIHKNKIYGPPSADERETEPMDPARIERLLKMMRGIDGKQWKRASALLT